MKNIQRFVPIAAFLSLSLTGVAIAKTALAQSRPSLGLSPTTPNFLLSIRREGGMCAAMGCFSEVAVLSNGTYRYADSLPKQRTGRLARGEVRRFQQRIANANFEAIKARPFTGTCPLAYDGPETVYTFRSGDRVEVLRSCQTQIEGSNPLFQQAERVYREVSEKG